MPKKESELYLNKLPTTIESITGSIHLLRDKKVILSSDLARLYQVEPRILIQAVKRNMNRFPEDFIFQLSTKETKNLKSQIVISSWGGNRSEPYAFTEQGIAMLSSVLNSERAIQVNIAIMRAFVKMRELIASNQELFKRLESLEKKTDAKFKVVFEVIKRLFKISPASYTIKRSWGV